MPPPNNLEIIQRLYDEFLSVPERLASPEMLEFFDPEVELEQSAAFLGTEGTFRGYEGLANAGRELFDEFRDIRWVPKRIEAQGDEVVARVVGRAHGRVSRVEVRAPTVHTWTLRNGRIVRWHVALDSRAEPR